ncbi:accessory Sec system protein Asp1 [Enterococcus sp. AZ103]|uniref:accessory Sec system protein Asp1 n=1 Tax=Enterococcus sp. AZ103 TaxID=2774628 RepID=UPI003F298359
MNYFIPNWKQSDERWDNNRALNIIKLFIENEIEHQLVLIHYLPFLRYKAMEYSIYPKNYWHLYDVLQNIHTKNGHPISIDELELPDGIEKIYSPHGILLVKNNQVCGEINFNKYGCIESIHFKPIEESDMEHTDYYDDRGFISSTEYFNDNHVLCKCDYYNEYGEITLTEYPDKEMKVKISSHGNKEFEHQEYTDINSLIIEVLGKKFQNFEFKKDNLISVTEENILAATKELQDKINIIRIIDDDQSLHNFDEEQFSLMLKTSSSIVTDSSEKQKELELFIKNHGGLSDVCIIRIPMYNTYLNLGMSNSVPNLVVFWKVNQLSEDAHLINRLLIKKVIDDEKIAVILEVNNKEEEDLLTETQKDIIDGHFGIDSDSDDFEKTKKFIQSKRKEQLYEADELAVKDLQPTDQWLPLVGAVDTYERISFRVKPSLIQLKKDFQQARIYVNLAKKNDLQIHAEIISAGIPMIIKTKSDYLVEDKNGKILKKIGDFSDVLEFYLNELDNWNKVLVENVQLIDEFGVETTIEKWRSIFNG